MKYADGFCANALAGVVLTAAYAPFAYFQLAPVVALFTAWAWRRHPPSRTLAYGYVFGLAHFGSSVYWVYYSMHDFGGAAPWFAAVATFLFIAALALYFALLGWVAALCTHRFSEGSFYYLVFPSLWVACEYLRSVLFSGFPWNLLGQSMIDSPFSGIFPWFGVFAASWFGVFIGTCAATALFSRQLRIYGVSLFLAALGIGWWTGQVQWTEPAGEMLNVGIVQSGISQNVKFDSNAFMHILKVHQTLTLELLDRDLVVWSETAIPAYYHQVDDHILLPLRDAIAANGHGNLLAGTFFFDQETQKRHNSLIAVTTPPQAYHKRHLVPFGEYVPLRALFGLFQDYVTIPMSNLHAGSGENLLTVGAHKIGVSICYEVTFGREVITALPAAAYLVNVSNDSWFGDSIAPDQHLQIARLRAAEAGRTMIRATSTGISALIDHQGQVIRRSGRFSAQTLNGNIQPRQGATLYARYGDWPILAYIIVLLTVCFLFNQKNKPAYGQGAV